MLCLSDLTHTQNVPGDQYGQNTVMDINLIVFLLFLLCYNPDVRFTFYLNLCAFNVSQECQLKEKIL